MHNIRAAIRDHLYALESSSAKHEILYYNTAAGVPAWIRHTEFDAVILHTTLLCLRWKEEFEGLKSSMGWIRDLECLKLAMPQDEYDHSEILDEWLHGWGVSIIFTNFGPEHREQLYPIMHHKAEFRRAFTGYIQDDVARDFANRIAPLHARPKDIVYRATHLPYWFGSHGQLKHQIADAASKLASCKALNSDISTRHEDTIIGTQWLSFLASGKTVIGCESGSSVLDRRGEIRAAIRARLGGNAKLSFEEMSKELSPGWDAYTFFAIGPRHFEAVITKTCQILVEGHYDGVLVPHRHYIPVKRDLTNLDDALDKLKDLPGLQKIVDTAYEDIYRSGQYTYHSLAAQVDDCLRNVAPRRSAKNSWVRSLTWAAGRGAAGFATFKMSARDKFRQIKQSLR